MDPTVDHLMTQQISGVVHALADLPRLTEAQRQVERRTVTDTIRAFHPTNPIETMLAGHCVMFDTLLRDGMHDLRAGSSGPRVVASVLGTAKAFLRTFETLRRRQNPPAEKPRRQPVTAPAEAPLPAPVARAEPEITGPTVQAAPVKSAPVRAAPVRAAPVRAAPVQGPPVIAAPRDDPRPAAGSLRARLLNGSSHAAHLNVAREVPTYAPAPASAKAMAGGP